MKMASYFLPLSSAGLLAKLMAWDPEAFGFR